MITRPRFRYSWAVETAGEKYVFLLNEHRYVALEGRAYQRIAPLLDGQHTVDEIVAQLDGQVPLSEALYALQSLEKKGHIVEADDSLPLPSAAFWNYLDVDTRTATARLQEARVAVQAVGAVDTAALVQALQSLGIRVEKTGDLTIVVTDDYLQEGLEAINEEAVATGRPWMLLKPVGMLLWIGPIFRPWQSGGPADGEAERQRARTGCWACLAQRLRANRQVEAYILRYGGHSEPLAISQAALPSTQQVAMNLAATEIARWLVTGKSECLEGKVLTLDISSLEKQEHIFVRRPQCPVCGEMEYRQARQPQPVVLRSQKKRYTAEGGYRTALPQETFERYKHLISPITGVVSTLERTGHDESGLVYTFSAGHNFAMMSDDLFFLAVNIRGRSGGKGVTETQAKVSGLCEGVERYSGVYWGDETRVRASYNALKPQAVHPNACMLFSREQYNNRKEWNALQPLTRRHIVPEPFDEDREIDWTPMWSMTHNQFRYVPAAMCYYGHPDVKAHFSMLADSNGSAAGNNLEEAILQGFMEVVERDCVALWWYNRARRPQLDLDSFEMPYLERLRAHYTTLDRDLWVLDITSDLGIPAFVGVSRRTDNPVEDVIIGFGAHFDPKIALLRALTEVNQFLPCVTRRNPDGSTRYWYHDWGAFEWWKTATIASEPYLVPDPNLQPKKLSDYPRFAGDDLREDVNRCVEIIRQNDLELLVVDQTRPDIGLSVVKVMIPGLRHFWRRLGPGRLYDIPVKLGWLKEPLREDQLNSFNIFF